MDSATHAPSPLFVSHGSPMIALEPGPAGRFLARLGPAIDSTFGRPRGIVAVSAHTLANTPRWLAAPRHEAVHDFGGFPPALYSLRYDAPGAPTLAAEARTRLLAAGIDAPVSDEGGLDHGIWTVLRYLYPQADVPVLPLAWPPTASPAQLFALGQALAPLAQQGVLLLATGSITHNLRLLFGAGGPPAVDAPEIAESRAFRDWFAQRSAACDWPALFAQRSEAPHAREMHPSDEHLLPWFVAAGAGGDAAPPLRLHDSVTYGALGMDVYAFGPHAPALQASLSA